MEHVYIFSYISDDREGIFRDLTQRPDNGYVFLPTIKKVNGILGLIEKIHLSLKINNVINLPLKKIWGGVDGYDYDKEKLYVIIIPTASIAKLPIGYFYSLRRKHPNIRLMALVTDSMNASSPHMDCVRVKLFADCWDGVLTYDPYDAIEFGFTFLGYTYYSSFNFIQADNSESSDAFYIGFNKGNREQITADLYDVLVEHDVASKFIVVDKASRIIGESRFGLRSQTLKLKYPDVVSKVKSANCIIEILQQNQKAQSLRYLEAIVYNKKLLTNNTNISNLPFFDDRYMKSFSSVEDIDFDWVKTAEPIDYGYKDEFSPIYIKDFIEHNVML